MSEKKKPTKTKKYDKPVTLGNAGGDFKSIVRVILKSPPMPKSNKQAKKNKPKSRRKDDNNSRV